MKSAIVHSDAPITLFGGGESIDHVIDLALTHAPTAIAADGGANIAMARQVPLAAVIGDGDSITAATRNQLSQDVLFEIPEQDSTDFDKALRNIKAPLILAVGFTGARIDHQLAAMTSLATHPWQRCIILGRDEGVFLCPPELHLDLPKGSVFSLYPMGPVCGHSIGLEWPIGGLKFAPDGRIGTSNRVTGPVALTFDAPRMLAIFPLAALDQVIPALLAAHKPWPVSEAHA